MKCDFALNFSLQSGSRGPRKGKIIPDMSGKTHIFAWLGEGKPTKYPF